MKTTSTQISSRKKLSLRTPKYLTADDIFQFTCVKANYFFQVIIEKNFSFVQRIISGRNLYNVGSRWFLTSRVISNTCTVSIKALGRSSSTAPRSLENRFNILPEVFKLKNLIAAWMTLINILSCNLKYEFIVNVCKQKLLKISRHWWSHVNCEKQYRSSNSYHYSTYDENCVNHYAFFSAEIWVDSHCFCRAVVVSFFF